MSKWTKNTGVEPLVGNTDYEVKLRDGDKLLSGNFNNFDWVMDGNDRDIVEWRFVDEKPTEKELTQSEVQQLLHILRSQLDVVSFHKAMHKDDAAALWEICDKSDKFTSGYFENFSFFYAAYKQSKVEEKKLVSLITKLKGLK